MYKLNIDAYKYYEQLRPLIKSINYNLLINRKRF